MVMIPTSTKHSNAGRFSKNAFKNTGYQNPNEHKTKQFIMELYIGNMRIMTCGSDEMKTAGRYKKAGEKWKKDTNEILKSMGKIPNANYKCYETTDALAQVEYNQNETILNGGSTTPIFKKKK